MTRTTTSDPAATAATSPPARSAAGAPDDSTEPTTLVPRVAVVGIHGHGNSHLVNARALQDKGLCRLVAVADPRPPAAGSVDADVSVFADLTDLLGSTQVDIVVLCTPIHTHAALAGSAMRAGADVLLEKPPVPTMAEFRDLEALCAETGRSCQIGFQSLGSDAVSALADAVGAGVLGEVTSISARCAWVRAETYFRRSRWSGHRELDGVPVMDGVLTNPFAHAVATALRVDGSNLADDVLSVEADLFHANDISSDDTSTVRIRTRRGTTILLAATLCSPTVEVPEVIISGTLGTAVLSYTTDRIRIIPAPGHTDPAVALAGDYGRGNLLANLIAHRADPGVELIAELTSTGAFTAVLEALRLAPAPVAIPESCFSWVDDDAGRHAVVTDVLNWVGLAAERGQTFTELGAPWTSRGDDAPAALSGTAGGPDLRIGDTVVATYDRGFGVTPTSSPRPFLHPVRTLGGFVVTDAHPADHDWHLGIGVAVQDVDGWNLWGGRTYVRDRGYQWLGDNGRMDHVEWLAYGPDHAVERLRWLDGRGRTLLHEQREIRWRAADPLTTGVTSGWLLEFAFTLTAPGTDPVTLGSPGTNGRADAGYGGFFWRLPRTESIEIRTPDAVGEDQVHGRVADWLAVTLRNGDSVATLVLSPADGQTAADRWFVRSSGYPGVGSSLAWDTPVQVDPGRPLRRAFRALIADGTIDPEALPAAAQARVPTETGPAGGGSALRRSVRSRR
jgi:predicted dehydrogenase